MKEESRTVYVAATLRANPSPSVAAIFYKNNAVTFTQQTFFDEIQKYS